MFASQALTANGELVRMAGRDQASIVGELTLDQAGCKAKVAHLEGCLALTEAKGHLLLRSQKPLELPEGTRRNEHALAFTHDRGARDVPHCETVRVGGHQAKTTGFRREQHTGQDRSGIVGAGCWDDLVQRSGEFSSRDRDRIIGGHGQSWKLIGG